MATFFKCGLLAKHDVLEIVRPAQRDLYRNMVRPLEERTPYGEPDVLLPLLKILGIDKPALSRGGADSGAIPPKPSR